MVATEPSSPVPTAVPAAPAPPRLAAPRPGVPPGVPAKRPRLLPLDRAGVAAVLALVLVATGFLVAGGTLVGQDSATQFYPWYDFLGERLRAGDLPAWSPHQFAGAPFAGDPQSGWTYLPSMTLFAVLPLQLAVVAFLFAHLAIASLGTYALARTLGMGLVGGLVAAAAYTLTGSLYGRSPCCPASLEVAAWFPLTLLGMEIAIRAPGWRRRVLGWGVAGVALSQILAAWLGQGSYYALLALGAFVAYRILLAPPHRDAGADVDHHPWLHRFAHLAANGAAVLIVGFGLAAAGILPRLEFNAVSNVAGGEYRSGGAADAAAIGGASASDVLGRIFGPTLYYPGAATLALAIVAVLLARGRFGATYFAGLAFGAMVLTVRATTPLHRLLYELLPRFEELHQHWPERAILVAYLAPALLAGATVDSLVSWRDRPRRLVSAAAAPIAVLALLAALGGTIPAAALATTAAACGLVAATTVLARPAARRWVPALLLLVVCVDLFGTARAIAADGPFGGFHRVDIAEYYAPTGAAAFLRGLPADDPFRYAGYDPGIAVAENAKTVLYRYQFADPRTRQLLVNNRATVLGLEDSQGYNPVQVARYVDLVAAMNGGPQEYHGADVYPPGLDSPLLDLLNVRYLVIPASIPEDRPDLRRAASFSTVYADAEVRVVENPGALPRAWIVHEATRVEAGGALGPLAAGAVDPRRVALVEGAVPPLAPAADPAADAVSFAGWDPGTPDRLRLTTRTDAPGLLVLSEVAYPAWRAYVDGERVDVLTVDHALRGVPIPAGEHTVELRFESTALSAGLAITATTLAVLALVALLALWPRRPGG